MTGWRKLLIDNMPHMLAHEGHWDGIYRHQDANGKLLDEHRVLTHCEFPDDGEFAYIQHSDLIWENGQKAHYEFGGVYRDGKVYWDTDVSQAMAGKAKDCYYYDWTDWMHRANVIQK